MLATITGSVLATAARTTQAGQTYVTVYLLQPGRQDPVQAYYAPADLAGAEPVQGETLTAEVLVYADRNGRLSVRLERTLPAVAAVAA